MKDKKVIGYVAGGLVVACCLLGWFAAVFVNPSFNMEGADPNPIYTLAFQTAYAQITMTAKAATATYTYTPRPTNTAKPTSTPKPTLTFTATVTEGPSPTPEPTKTIPPTIDSTKTNKGNGFYLINVDIAPGIWRSLGSSDQCYWSVTTKTGDIIDNHFGMSGGTAYIPPGGFQIEFNGCGAWEYIGPP